MCFRNCVLQAINHMRYQLKQIGKVQWQIQRRVSATTEAKLKAQNATRAHLHCVIATVNAT